MSLSCRCESPVCVLSGVEVMWSVRRMPVSGCHMRPNRVLRNRPRLFPASFRPFGIATSGVNDVGHARRRVHARYESRGRRCAVPVVVRESKGGMRGIVNGMAAWKAVKQAVTQVGGVAQTQRYAVTVRRVGNCRCVRCVEMVLLQQVVLAVGGAAQRGGSRELPQAHSACRRPGEAVAAQTMLRGIVVGYSLKRARCINCVLRAIEYPNATSKTAGCTPYRCRPAEEKPVPISTICRHARSGVLCGIHVDKKIATPVTAGECVCAPRACQCRRER